MAGDITSAQCLLYTAVFESCIQSGLIQSNTGYDQLFPVTTVCAQIVDRNYDTVFSSASASASAVPLPKALIRQTAEGAVALDRTTLVKGSAIRAGFAVWQEDISELVDAIDELGEKREEIAHANEVERENYNTRRLISQLREKNRLYDFLQAQTAQQNEKLSGLLDDYCQAEDEKERRRLATRASNWRSTNPDVLDFSQATGCTLDIDESKSELKRKDAEGNEVSFNPPRYEYSYDFNMTVHVNSPYFSEIRFQINDDDITQRGGAAYREAQAKADEIKSILTKVRDAEREAAQAAAKPKASVKCPYCGAVVVPGPNGKCEFCGSVIGV